MSYILKKVEVNGNADMYGGSDTETLIAISDDALKLKDYCEKTFDCTATIGDKHQFEWTYYKIVETTMIIL